MKTKFWGFLLAGISLWMGDVAGFDLREALQAYRQSPGVLKSKSIESEMEWKRVESLSGLLPELSAHAGRLLSKRYVLTDVQLSDSSSVVSIPQRLSTTSYSLHFGWKAFDGLSNWQNYLAAGHDEKAARRRFDSFVFDHRQKVIMLFYQALATKTLREVAQLNLKTFEDHLADTKAFLKSGLTTRYDVLKVEFQVDQAKSDLQLAEDNALLAKNELAESVGLESIPSEIQGELPALDSKIVEMIQTKVGERPDIQALEQTAQAENLRASSERKFWIPEISFYGDYTQYNNRNDRWFDSGDFREAYVLGLQLHWNIFDGMKSIAKSQQSAEQSFQARKDLELKRLTAKNEMEIWKRRFLYFCQLYKTQLANLKRAEEGVRLAKEGKREGTKTDSDLLDVELELVQARAGIVNAQLGSVDALSNLQISTGKTYYSFLKDEEIHE